jgi:hypothetical protein
MGQRTITEAQFEQEFGYVERTDGSVYYSCPPDDTDVMMAAKDRRIWTFVDGDGGDLLLSGWHFVNRYGFAISKKPWAEDDIVTVVVEPTDGQLDAQEAPVDPEDPYGWKPWVPPFHKVKT